MDDKLIIFQARERERERERRDERKLGEQKDFRKCIIFQERSGAHTHTKKNPLNSIRECGDLGKGLDMDGVPPKGKNGLSRLLSPGKGLRLSGRHPVVSRVFLFPWIYLGIIDHSTWALLSSFPYKYSSYISLTYLLVFPDEKNFSQGKNTAEALGRKWPDRVKCKVYNLLLSYKYIQERYIICTDTHIWSNTNHSCLTKVLYNYTTYYYCTSTKFKTFTFQYTLYLLFSLQDFSSLFFSFSRFSVSV